MKPIKNWSESGQTEIRQLTAIGTRPRIYQRKPALLCTASKKKTQRENYSKMKKGIRKRRKRRKQKPEKEDEKVELHEWFDAWQNVNCTKPVTFITLQK